MPTRATGLHDVFDGREQAGSIACRGEELWPEPCLLRGRLDRSGDLFGPAQGTVSWMNRRLATQRHWRPRSLLFGCRVAGDKAGPARRRCRAELGQVGYSGVLAGTHLRFDHERGLTAGREVARLVMQLSPSRAHVNVSLTVSTVITMLEVELGKRSRQVVVRAKWGMV